MISEILIILLAEESTELHYPKISIYVLSLKIKLDKRRD